MTSRKQTPDIMAEILNGEAPAADFSLPVSSTSTKPKARKSMPPAGAAAEKPPSKKITPEKTAQVGPYHWEYQVVSFQDYKGFRPRFVDGKDVADWSSGPMLHELLQSMAEQGWELVSASSGERLYGVSDKHQLYFRRRLAG